MFYEFQFEFKNHRNGFKVTTNKVDDDDIFDIITHWQEGAKYTGGVFCIDFSEVLYWYYLPYKEKPKQWWQFSWMS